jgi:hypothetical protein
MGKSVAVTCVMRSYAERACVLGTRRWDSRHRLVCARAHDHCHCVIHTAYVRRALSSQVCDSWRMVSSETCNLTNG